MFQIEFLLSSYPDTKTILSKYTSFNSGNARTICEIYSNLTMKTPERRYCRRSSVFVVNFEQISHTVLMLALFTFNK